MLFVADELCNHAEVSFKKPAICKICHVAVNTDEFMYVIVNTQGRSLFWLFCSEECKQYFKQRMYQRFGNFQRLYYVALRKELYELGRDLRNIESKAR